MNETGSFEKNLHAMSDKYLDEGSMHVCGSRCLIDGLRKKQAVWCMVNVFLIMKKRRAGNYVKIVVNAYINFVGNHIACLFSCAYKSMVRKGCTCRVLPFATTKKFEVNDVEIFKS
ncbi:uncharacterized protein LOC121259389 [Juglans microcarpa x Juglans regia]|uniref:uncharacterized protein LOC121259389 n=1 Tax=Juglans microcarpa x Juglans regia TaxID=2249226 RepID=UPI001B7ECB50|nr:uncharacterized protein LOC121259389 [Juglans microcarpa x Juglans regia]